MEHRRLGQGGRALLGRELSSLRDFYTDAYDAGSDGARLGRWRDLGAASKAAHVRALCGEVAGPVVEIGCGDGALLSRLPGSPRTGFELSPTAVALARERGLDVREFDGERLPVDDGACSLAVVSHVLEHVPSPLPLLLEAARVAPRVLVEVPLEANRSAQRPAKVAEARAIGHVQAFSRADVEALARDAGLRVVASLTDPLPLRHHAFFASTPQARLVAGLKWAVRWGTWRVAPRAAERWFTVHYAALLAR